MADELTAPLFEPDPPESIDEPDEDEDLEDEDEEESNGCPHCGDEDCDGCEEEEEEDPETHWEDDIFGFHVELTTQASETDTMINSDSMYDTNTDILRIVALGLFILTESEDGDELEGIIEAEDDDLRYTIDEFVQRLAYS